MNHIAAPRGCLQTRDVPLRRPATQLDEKRRTNAEKRHGHRGACGGACDARDVREEARLPAWQRRWNAGAPACGPSVLPETASSNKKDAASEGGKALNYTSCTRAALGLHLGCTKGQSGNLSCLMAPAGSWELEILFVLRRGLFFARKREIVLGVFWAFLVVISYFWG